MTSIVRTFIGVLVCVVGLSASAFEQLTKEAAIGKAEAILKNLQDGKLADVVKEFDARMTQEVPEAKLTGAWTGVVSQFGAFKSITERREGQVKDRQMVELILAFERETIVQRVAFDAQGKVAGLVFRPLSAAVLPAPK
jgi:uncharacterized protein